MKRKYREAMRAASRARDMQFDEDDEAIEARDWHDEWAQAPRQQQDQTNHQEWSKQ